MPQSTKPQPQLNSFLRVVREDESPVYDAVPSPKLAGGFAMIPHEIIDQLIGDGDAMAVFFAISKHANKDGECWPSVAKLMEITGYSDRHVRDKINRLVDLKVITKTPRSGGMKSVNVYRICQKSPEVLSGTQYRTSGTRNRTDRHVVPDSAVPGAGRTITSELEPIELVNPSSPQKTKTTKPQYTPEFRKFMELYPSGRGSFADAFKLWQKLDADDIADVMDALPKFRAGREWQEGFQPGPEVWIRGRRWENPPQPFVSRSTGNGDPLSEKPPGCPHPMRDLLRMDATGEYMTEKYREIVRAYKASH